MSFFSHKILTLRRLTFKPRFYTLFNIFSTNFHFFMSKRIVLLAVLVFSTLVTFNACKHDKIPNVDCTTIDGATYDLKVQEIISENCLGCHATGGSAADNGIFETYAQAKNKGGDIYNEVVTNKSMPPSGALPDSLINILHCWKEGGYPEN